MTLQLLPSKFPYIWGKGKISSSFEHETLDFFSGFFFKALWPSILPVLRIRIRIHRIHMFLGLPYPDTVRGVDPDPSIIPLLSSKIARKTLILKTLWLLVDFLSLKNEVMYLQKVISRYFFFNWFFVGVLKVNDGNSRIRICIRIQIHYSEAWIPGSRTGSTPKCHGSPTLHSCDPERTRIRI